MLSAQFIFCTSNEGSPFWREVDNYRGEGNWPTPPPVAPAEPAQTPFPQFHTTVGTALPEEHCRRLQHYLETGLKHRDYESGQTTLRNLVYWPYTQEGSAFWGNVNRSNGSDTYPWPELPLPALCPRRDFTRNEAGRILPADLQELFTQRRRESLYRDNPHVRVDSFPWSETAEGAEFWSRVNNHGTETNWPRVPNPEAPTEPIEKIPEQIVRPERTKITASSLFNAF